MSCSVVRRVALPDAFFATDGLFQTLLTVLDEFGAYPAVVDRELDRYLPFLATTRILVEAARRGVGREAAHEAIKEHAVAVALAHAGEGRRRPTTCSTGSPPTPGSGCPGPRSTRWSPTGRRSSARRRLRSAPSSTGSPRSWPCTPTPAGTRPPRSSDDLEWLTAAGDGVRPDRAAGAARQDLRRHAGALHPLPAAAGVARRGGGVRGAVRGGGRRRPAAHAAARPAGARSPPARCSRSAP